MVDGDLHMISDGEILTVIFIYVGIVGIVGVLNGLSFYFGGCIDT